MSCFRISIVAIVRCVCSPTASQLVSSVAEHARSAHCVFDPASRRRLLESSTIVNCETDVGVGKLFCNEQSVPSKRESVCDSKTKKPEHSCTRLSSRGTKAKKDAAVTAMPNTSPPWWSAVVACERSTNCSKYDDFVLANRRERPADRRDTDCK